MSSIVSLEIAGSSFATEIEGSDLKITGFKNLENIIEAENLDPTPISLIGGNKADKITVIGEGDATLLGGNGDDTLLGGDGDDLIEGGNGKDMLFGGDGDDIILGGNGKDLIEGGNGADTIKGGMGADVLQGGEGDDVFEFMTEEFASNAIDEIEDFEDMGDMIKIMGVGEDSTVTYDEVTGMVSIDGEAVIDIGEGMDVEATKNDDTWELF